MAANAGDPFLNALKAGAVLSRSRRGLPPDVQLGGYGAPAPVPGVTLGPASNGGVVGPQVVAPPKLEVDQSELRKFLPTCPTVYAVVSSLQELQMETPDYGKGDRGIQEGYPVMTPPGKQDMDTDAEHAGPLPPGVVVGFPALVTLPLSNLGVKVECQISTGFVTVDGTWRLDCIVPGQRCDCLLAVPLSHQGTVMGVEIDMGNGRMYATLVVPKDEAAAFGAKGSRSALPDDPNSYNPELFRLTIPAVDANATLHLTITWFQPMLFTAGLYTLSVPLVIPATAMTAGTSGLDNLNQLLRLSCTINTGSPVPVVTGDFNYPMKTVEGEPGRLVTVADTAKQFENKDFVCSYQVWTEGILTNLIVQEAPPNDPDPRGTFSVAVSPPDPANVTPFQRAVVFVVDRSGSMDGFPMQDAQHAIVQGLQLLRPEDHFNIIGFDHQQIAFDAGLVPATPENVASACEWVTRVCRARGTTDILTPLQQALQMLSLVEGAVPYIFLVTDGAVDNERVICRTMKGELAVRGASAPRISTFGIGHYCNFFFLKMLASIGRGVTDVAFQAGKIREQIERMLVAASTPLLTNVRLDLTGLEGGCEVYPFPIPDLFCGKPLVISGKFPGQFPGEVKIVATLPDGSDWTRELQVESAPQIPLAKVFVKQQLDMLTAQAWLEEDLRLKKQLTQQVVNLSVNHGVPSEHTTMIGFETTPAKLERLKSEIAQGKRPNPKKYAVTKYAAIGVVGGLAIGFGSVLATTGNLGPIGDILGSALGGIGDAGSAIGGCCGECFGAIGGGCGDCWGLILGGCGDCWVGIFGCCGDGCGCILGFFECCGSDFIGCLGETAGCLCNVVGAFCS